MITSTNSPLRLLIFVVLLGAANAALAQYYRWIDQNGVMCYGEIPPADRIPQQVEIYPGPSAAEMRRSRQQMERQGCQKALLFTVGHDILAHRLDQARADARQAVDELVMPHRKLEAWRYSDLGALYKQPFRDSGTRVLQDSDIEQCVYSINDSHRLVFANGHFVAEMSSIHTLPEGVIIANAIFTRKIIPLMHIDSLMLFNSGRARLAYLQSLTAIQFL